MTDWTPRLSFSKRFWVGCAITLLAASFLFATLIQARGARALAKNGVLIEATVTDVRANVPLANEAGKPEFYLTYTYSVNTQTHTNERSVPRPFLDDHPIGAVWAINVHPDNPTLHDLYPGQTRSTAWGFFTASILLAVFGIGLALSGGNLAVLRTRLKAPTS